MAVAVRGGSGLGGARNLPVDLASSAALSLNDTVSLRVGGSSIAGDTRKGLWRFPGLQGRSAGSRSVTFPFPFVDVRVGDGCSMTLSLG